MNEILNILPVGAEAATIEKLADVTVKYLEYRGECEKWRGRIEALNLAFAQHGRSERVALEERRLFIELTKFTIELYIATGEPDKALEVFRECSARTPDFLGTVLTLIKGRSEAAVEA
ncbi:hypothetical protein AS593_09410 [Caulobacter vibrioides]|nr:hypothetical protein AS593_09410 [Caulobacter vibrioides]